MSQPKRKRNVPHLDNSCEESMEKKTLTLPFNDRKEYSSDGFSFEDLEEDDDDLPDISSQVVKSDKKFTKDDIVWAPFEDIYWPAVVTSIHNRNVRFVWVNEKRGLVYKKKANLIKSFDDEATNSRLKQLGEGRFSDFREAYELVTKYFLRRQSGNVSAKRFLTFCDGKDGISPHKDQLYRMGCDLELDSDDTVINDNDNTDSDSNDSHDNDEDNHLKLQDCSEELNQDQHSIEELPVIKEQEMKSLALEAEEALLHIRTEECFDYLKSIRCGSMDSERHQSYPNLELLSMSGLGPFTNFSDKTVRFLDIIEEYCEIMRDVDPSYKLQVLIPEAIIFSLMKMRNVDKKTASSHYLKFRSTIGKQSSAV